MDENNTEQCPNYDQYCDSVPAYKLEELEQQLAAKDAEIERLRKLAESYMVGGTLALQRATHALCEKLDAQRKALEALWVMLNAADRDGKSIWAECEDCLDEWTKCNIHHHCKSFYTSDTLDEFIIKLQEVEDSEH